MNIEAKKFEERGWLTPNQYRDQEIEQAIRELKRLAFEEDNRRKSLPDVYVQCPICKGWHEQKDNIDKLCEKHESQTAPYRYDIAKFGPEKALEIYKRLSPSFEL